MFVMNTMNRRDLCVAFSAFAALGSVSAEGQSAGAPILDKSRVLAYDQLPVVKLGNGGTQRKVMSGTLPTGEFVEVHETMLPAGQMPHPPHKHPNTEFLFIKDGKLEYLDDGKPIPVSAGGIVFSASNIMHGLRNIGDTPANYIVVSVGKQIAEP
jgi:quercetin dioxygenase-like cupin family protein